MAEEQTHFEIIECESHMPVAIRQFDSEEEAMEYLNMRLKSEQPTHPSERHEAQESEGTTAQGLHEFSEQLRIPIHSAHAGNERERRIQRLRTHRTVCRAQQSKNKKSSWNHRRILSLQTEPPKD